MQVGVADREKIDVGIGIRLAAIERPAEKGRAQSHIGFEYFDHMFEQRELGEFLRLCHDLRF